MRTWTALNQPGPSLEFEVGSTVLEAPELWKGKVLTTCTWGPIRKGEDGNDSWYSAKKKKKSSPMSTTNVMILNVYFLQKLETKHKRLGKGHIITAHL